MPSIETTSRISGKRIHSRPWEMAFLMAVCILTAYAPLEARGKSLETIRLGAFEYPPFYWEEKGEVRGIAVEIIDQLFRRLGTGTSLRLFPLKRALGYAREGIIDGIMILIKTPERTEFLYYTDPVITVRGLIWFAADRKGGLVHFNRLEDLRPYVTGATLGYSYGPEFDELLKTMKVQRVASDYLNYKKLMAHRIDIFPGNEIVAKGLFKRHPELRGKFNHSDRSFIEWKLHMGISKKSPLARYIPEINTIIDELDKAGLIRKTVEKFTE